MLAEAPDCTLTTVLAVIDDDGASIDSNPVQNMSSFRSFALSGAALVALALPASAQTFQSEVATDLRAVADKYVSLAEAMPASTYDWRPEEGVRSVSEVFMHVAGANMGLPNMFMGVTPPEGYSREWFGSAEDISDKAAVVEHVRASFDHLIGTVEGLSDADLQRSVTVFGRETNWMGAAMLLQTHTHEHLGQAIAYARSNGVTPPWSN